MQAWKKTSPEVLAAFEKAVPALPTITRRPMFGYASAFVNGNMFAGTFQDAIVVRLSEADRVALLKLKGAAPFEPMGRPMKEYVVVPPSVAAKPGELRAWIDRAHGYARSLPPKIKSKTTHATESAAVKSTAGRSRARKVVWRKR